MNKDDAIKELVKLSSYAGQHIAFVQGAGGNTSVKLQDGTMVLKASGYLLNNVTETTGYALVPHEKVLDFLNDDQLSEETYMKNVISMNGIDCTRPSMEVGFHAALGPVVLHSHSVFANVLNCSIEGKDLIEKMFPEATYISYQHPGRDLSRAVASNSNSHVYFLQNHGIIITGNSVDAVIESHEKINLKIIQELNLDDFEGPAKYVAPGIRGAAKYLFPDQALYGTKDQRGPGFYETYYAGQYILAQLTKLKFNPNFLTDVDCAMLLGMEAEKYRMEIC